MNQLSDLTHLSSADQTVFLKDMEQRRREQDDHLDTTIYLLRGTAEDIRTRLLNIRIGFHDIDGTHTTVGGHRIFNESIQGLKEFTASGGENIAVTGRHQGQVEEVIANHPEGTGMDAWLMEQGFFLRTGAYEAVLFEGRPEIAHHVDQVRLRVKDLLADLERRYDIRFETTSLRDGNSTLYPHTHKTMYSVDAVRNGQKINDVALHDNILGALNSFWLEQDPEGAIAHAGTSSIGTYEWTPDGLNKEGSVRRMLLDRQAEAREGIYLGDSGNDLPVFRNIDGLMKGVIINPHTNDSLIAHADIATVGIGNGAPILHLTAEARRSIKILDIPVTA